MTSDSSLSGMVDKWIFNRCKCTGVIVYMEGLMGLQEADVYQMPGARRRCCAGDHLITM